MRAHLRVHYFQHIAKEGLGSCESYLRQHDAQITATEFFALPPEQKLDIEALPRVEDIDLLIIMGGTMSVNDELEYPWLVTEKRWLRRFIALGKPVIGLCLGAQLISSALGAKVTQNYIKEVGWEDVIAVEPYVEHCFKVPKVFTVLQWHGETFSLPAVGVLLATNDTCKNQVFQINQNIVGFQFHPEITPQSLKLFLEDEGEVLRFFDGNRALKDSLELTTMADQIYRYQQGNYLLNQAIDYVVDHTCLN